MPRTELSHGIVHYRESGAGPPVVFLHGYPMGARLAGLARRAAARPAA
jgi:pimeloyl-ACP methyl ester carboxylesterase